MNSHFSQLRKGTKIYFASDFHLGAGSKQENRLRETRVVRWLECVRHDAAAIFLVGDIFDFWFEYNRAVPKGHVRFLGKLAEIRDSGVPVIIYTGNHDLWMQDYLEEELGVTIYKEPTGFSIQDKSFLIGHGDGLGPGDGFYKFMKKIFLNPFCKWAFKWLHPDIGVALATFWSERSRRRCSEKDKVFLGDKEMLLTYCRSVQSKDHFDFFIFGHRHLPLDIKLEGDSRYINLGEWITQCQYGVFDGEKFELKKFVSS